jgi:hypothetical protein
MLKYFLILLSLLLINLGAFLMSSMSDSVKNILAFSAYMFLSIIGMLVGITATIIFIKEKIPKWYEYIRRGVAVKSVGLPWVLITFAIIELWLYLR